MKIQANHLPVHQSLQQLREQNPVRYTELSQLAQSGETRALDQLAQEAKINPADLRDAVLSIALQQQDTIHKTAQTAQKQGIHGNHATGAASFFALVEEQKSSADIYKRGILPKPSMQANVSDIIKPFDAAQKALFVLQLDAQDAKNATKTVSVDTIKAELALKGASHLAQPLLQAFSVKHDMIFRGHPVSEMRLPKELTADQLGQAIELLAKGQQAVADYAAKAGSKTETGGLVLSKERLFGPAGSLGFQEHNPFTERSTVSQLAQAAIKRVAEPIEKSVLDWKYSVQNEGHFQEMRGERLAQVEIFMVMHQFESPEAANAVRWALQDGLLLTHPRAIHGREVPATFQDIARYGISEQQQEQQNKPSVGKFFGQLAKLFVDEEVKSHADQNNGYNPYSKQNPRLYFSNAAVAERVAKMDPKNFQDVPPDALQSMYKDALKDAAERYQSTIEKRLNSALSGQENQTTFDDYRNFRDRPSIAIDADLHLPVGIVAMRNR